MAAQLLTNVSLPPGSDYLDLSAKRSSITRWNDSWRSPVKAYIQGALRGTSSSSLPPGARVGSWETLGRSLSTPGQVSRGKFQGGPSRKLPATRSQSSMDGGSQQLADALPEASPMPAWTSSKEPASVIDPGRRIYCNRSLNMGSIVAVGFDMDYTLAQYRPESFETMAYKGTVEKLVHNLAYPEEILAWEFDWRYMVRGLVLDKRRGNILKMDRHKYVKVAYHGFCELPRQQRAATYGSSLARQAFDEPDFAHVDTLFSLAEAYLFAQLVELRDSFDPPPSTQGGGNTTVVAPELSGGSAPGPNVTTNGSARRFSGRWAKSPPDYLQIYRDVRSAVDLCHRDGTIKQEVARNPAKYIYRDDQIVPMVKMLRASGRMTFVVTNSLWDYTHVVMNYLCGKCGTDGGTPRDDSWLELFDIVITGSAKPGFFSDSSRSPIFEVDVASGMLRNTDNGSPLLQIGDSAPPVTTLAPDAAASQECRVFQGGNVAHLHSMLGIAASAQVLYVGDHIYGDILRSKKQLGWRTMLVVPELEREVKILAQTAELRKRFHQLRRERSAMDDSIQRLKWALRFEQHSEEERVQIQARIESTLVMRRQVREEHRHIMRQSHHQFHEVWGQLMKTGYQNSRFAHQVERFACLYTSHVGNLCFYSPDKSYSTSEDFMPHELDVLDLSDATAGR